MIGRDPVVRRGGYEAEVSRRLRLPLLCAALWLAATGARAEGGAHVVDDSEVETPGHCHLELWWTRLAPDAGLVNLGPGCTSARWPSLEFGGFLQPSAATGASGAGAAGPGGGPASRVEALFGPALKYTFRHDTTGLGVGLDAGLTYNGSRDRLEAASALVPLTFTPLKRLRLNLNAGATWVRADRALESFLGAQAELDLGRGVSLMVEHFGRSHGFAGDQAGVRWTPGGRNFDLDLVVGRRIDGVAQRAVSLGVTLRR